MKVAFIGYGGIARKHAEIIKKTYPSAQIFSVKEQLDSDSNSEVKQIDSKNISNFYLDAIFITNPSSFHVKSIMENHNLNIPIMVEKPICVNLSQLNQLKQLEKLKNPRIYCACNMRFHPIITFLKEYLKNNYSKINEVNIYCGSYLPDWRKGVDYRKNYSAKKIHGGGVKFDLMHEIDYLVYLLGFPEECKKFQSKVSNLEIDSNDFSHYCLKYGSFFAMVTLNYFRKDKKRCIEIVREDGTIMADFENQKILNLTSNELLFNLNYNGMEKSYELQIEYFFKSINNDQFNINGLKEAVEIMKIIL